MKDMQKAAFSRPCYLPEQVPERGEFRRFGKMSLGLSVNVGYE